jgi:large subunit ribosomal protein L28
VTIPNALPSQTKSNFLNAHISYWTNPPFFGLIPCWLETIDLRNEAMSRKCKLSGKGPLVGNNVSFSNKKTKRRQLPNLQSKRVFVPEVNRVVTIRMSTRAMRTVDKIGLMPYLKKQGLELKDVVK